MPYMVAKVYIWSVTNEGLIYNSQSLTGGVMDTRKAVAERLRDLCKERNIAVHTLARNSAVPPSTLKNIINGGSLNPGVVTLKKLCDGLDITLGEFFNTTEFEALEQEIK